MNQGMDEPGALQRLLFGSPFCERTDGFDPATAQLDGIIDALVEFLRLEHGSECPGFRQAEREIADVRAMPCDIDAAIFAKRALLLFGLWRDPAFGDRFKATDSALLADLRTRILPIAAPPFLNNLGQTPDSFVRLCAVIRTQWEGIEFKFART